MVRVTAMMQENIELQCISSTDAAVCHLESVLPFNSRTQCYQAEHFESTLSFLYSVIKLMRLLLSPETLPLQFSVLNNAHSGEHHSLN